VTSDPYASALSLARAGQRDAALGVLETLLAATPDHAQAWTLRAAIEVQEGRAAEAFAAAERALALDPRIGLAWRHRGHAQNTLGQPEAALESYRSALPLVEAGVRATLLAEVGQILINLGRYAEAVATLDEAAAADPTAAVVRWRRGEARLAQHDFARGWDDYEARWLTPGFLEKAVTRTSDTLRERLTLNPTLEDLRGQRVLVAMEQGVGDEIMFASVLPDLARVAAKVLVNVERRLVSLLSASMPEVEFIAGQGPGLFDLSRFDRVVALGSLPSVFRRAPVDFPGAPYLAPPRAVADAWRERLGPKRARLRIGVSWRGGAAWTRAVARSMPLETLRPLLARPDCEFVSLQYGDATAEIAAMNATLDRPIASLPAQEIDDFAQLAGLVAGLDLVVTVQTALAHLTGAIGQRGLVMIPRQPEWRYGASGDAMPWYGSLRLLRQEGPDGWPPVVARVGEALDAIG